VAAWCAQGQLIFTLNELNIQSIIMRLSKKKIKNPDEEILLFAAHI
jgi:hypothetical protein